MDLLTKKILSDSKLALERAVEIAKRNKENAERNGAETKSISSIENLLANITEQIKGYREDVKRADMDSMVSTFKEISKIVSTENETLAEEKLRKLQNYIDEKVAISEARSKEMERVIKEIETKIPARFLQDEIKGLKFSQLSHLDSDHKKTIESLEGLAKNIAKIRDSFEKKGKELSGADEALREKLNNIKIISKHNELQGIGADDHHKEIHTIETHSGLKATTENLNNLVDGGFADNLHKHKEKPIVMSATGLPRAAILNLIFEYIGKVEIPTGDINGVNTTFTVLRQPLWISWNGQVKYSYDDDGYTLSSDGLTITTKFVPQTGDLLRSHSN